MYLVFDLDLTLVDSSVAESSRTVRLWQEVYSLIPSFRLYDGLDEVFSVIRAQAIKMAIVSSTPSVYVRKVVDYFNFPVDVIVGYHDAARKPSPEGFTKALQRMGGNPSEAISFGDRAIDICASKAAELRAVACLWGTKEKKSLLSSGPDTVLSTPSEIVELLNAREARQYK